MLCTKLGLYKQESLANAKVNVRQHCVSPTYPALRPPLGGTASEFLDETYPAETRGMGILYGENCIILTSNAFD